MTDHDHPDHHDHPAHPQHHDRAELTDERLARITARVHAGIATSSPAPGRSLTLLRAAIVLLVVATAAFAGWAYDTTRGGSPDGPASSPTAPGPEDLAALAARRPATPIGDGYAHLSVRTRTGDLVATDERWTAADGTGRTRLTRFGPDGTPGDPEERAVTEPDGLSIAGFTPAEVAALGGDVEQVFAALVDVGGYRGEPAASASRSVLDLLAWPVVPPATRAALFGILADLGYRAGPAADPGTTVLVGPGQRVRVQDAAGASTDHETVNTVTFDARTTALVRYRVRATDGPRIDDTVNVLESAVTATPY